MMNLPTLWGLRSGVHAITQQQAEHPTVSCESLAVRLQERSTRGEHTARHMHCLLCYAAHLSAVIIMH